MNELECIKAFLRVAEKGNQLLAAESLNQTSAAINKKLIKLEDLLGVTLLERSNKGSMLTSIGQEYYAIYRDAVDRLDDVKQLQTQMNANPKGRLLISTNQVLASHYIFSDLTQFIQHYSLINLVFDIADKPNSYLPDKNEIWLHDCDIKHDELIKQRFFTTRKVLCAAPKYLKKYNPIESINDVKQLDYIALCMRSPINHIELDKKLIINNIESKIRVNDEYSAIQLALNGNGFIQTHEFKVKSYLNSGQLVEFLGEQNQRNIDINFYYRQSRLVNKKIRLFIDYLKKSEIYK